MSMPLKSFIALINGRHEMGRSRLFWSTVGLVVAGFLLYPVLGSAYEATNVAYLLLNIPIALGLCLLWGYGGVLSFGQVAYFGVAGYAYGIIAGNFASVPGGTILGVFGGIGLALILAVIFGYFVFYGRVAAWIVPILTLVLTLLLETFLGLTAGYSWRVGSVQLGGYNGMNGIPPLSIGGFVFQDYAFYFLTLGVVLAAYLLSRAFVNSHRGQVMIAIREDVLRSELLGYDIRREQLFLFIIAAGLAAVSGILYVQWGNYITPSSMGLQAAALPVIWVAVGGRDSLTAAVVSTFLLNELTYQLAAEGNKYALVIVGGLLVAVMLFAPEGLIGELAKGNLWQRLGRRTIRSADHA